MSESSQMNNENISDLERAKQLRREAEMLEQKERVRGRLRQLIEISKDPYYDQYLMQMMKDLDNGKATPEQVSREAERSYRQYQQRMAQAAVGKPQSMPAQIAQSKPQSVPVQTARPQKSQGASVQSQAVAAPAQQPKRNGIEFKVGIHAFSLIGAVFVLIAFVIFSNRFMNGFWQGICLYLAAAALVVLSELLLNRRSPRFSHVVTGIGIGGLYAANMANYLALHVVNGIAAMAIAIVTALFTLAISRKKDSTVIRIIGLLGCYISFFPIKGFGTELSFLITGLMILAINLISAFLQNQRNQELLNILHIAANTVFTLLLLLVSTNGDIQPIYRVLYVITSFAFVEVLCLRQYKKGQNGLLLAGYIVNGIHIALLFLVATPSSATSNESLFIRLIAEALVALFAVGVFVLWDKEDKRRFAQLYYIVFAVLLLSMDCDYHLELILAVIGMFLIVRLLSGHAELMVLDCITAVWTAGVGIWYADYWYCWLFPGALLLGLLIVKQKPLFHEILVTAACLFTWIIYATSTLPDVPFLKNNESLSVLAQHIVSPVEIAGLFLLFLLINHWKRLCSCDQKPYNIINLVLTAVSYGYFWLYNLTNKMIIDAYAWAAGWRTSRNWIIASMDAVMLVLGVIYILIVLKKRYGFEISWKHWILTGFLIISILTGHYGTPVIVSILLMIIALGCVGFGFKLRDKSERICGLVLAAIVCLKLVLYDFREVSDMYRVIVFLAVGILALIISFIYIQLEKNMDKQNVKPEPEEVEMPETEEPETEPEEERTPETEASEAEPVQEATAQEVVSVQEETERAEVEPEQESSEE